MSIEVTVAAVATAEGPLALYRPTLPASSAEDPSRPVALMVHGALGAAGVLFPAFLGLMGDFEPTICELPGHGRSPRVPAPGVETFGRQIAVVAEVFRGRDLLLIGESLGGLAVLAAAAELTRRGAPPMAVVAVDPPLSTAKQWHVGAAFRAVMAERPDDAFVRALGWNLFGVRPGEVVMAERLYYPLLTAAGVPVLLLTGDVPLGAPRPMDAVACCLDGVDEYILRGLPEGRVRLRRLSGVGHVALRERPEDCLGEIRAFLADIGVPTPGGARP